MHLEQPGLQLVQVTMPEGDVLKNPGAQAKHMSTALLEELGSLVKRNPGLHLGHRIGLLQVRQLGMQGPQYPLCLPLVLLILPAVHDEQSKEPLPQQLLHVVL